MNKSYVIAIAMAVGAAAWILSGQFGGSGTSSPTPEAPASAEADTLPQVRVAHLAARPMVNEIVVNGRTEAARSVELRTEIAGRVEEVLALRGQPVEAGDPIVRIAVDAREADLAEARALLAQRRLEFDAARQLGERGFQSEVRVAEAKAAFDAAQAAMMKAQLDFERTTVRAPFGGILDKRSAEVGAYLDPGAPVAEIVDLNPLRVVGYATEREVLSIERGAAGHVRMLDGTEIEGRVIYVAAAADPATRTFRVELEVPNPDGRIVDGMTAQLRIPVARQLAHFISPALLTLDDDGSVGVKLVDRADEVRFQPVRILKDTADGVWIGGLPDEVTLISVGQDFVIPGQKVRAVPTMEKAG
ncbi:MAG TPA: efflux RND transporter periplasmic adaptor subunit [Arenibaculum sp.]|nr:efflux RND transporter periplasmic adaptor subunit [Arenibaculum sp.]